MKDKLVFVITESDDHGTCNGCDFFEQDLCGINLLKPCAASLSPFIYKLQKEEPKIQTEYEHNQKRFDLLKSLDLTILFTLQQREVKYELLRLAEYFDTHKPINFVTCNKENTKIGCSVRNIKT